MKLSKNLRRSRIGNSPLSPHVPCSVLNPGLHANVLFVLKQNTAYGVIFRDEAQTALFKDTVRTAL